MQYATPERPNKPENGVRHRQQHSYCRSITLTVGGLKAELAGRNETIATWQRRKDAEFVRSIAVEDDASAELAGALEVLQVQTESFEAQLDALYVESVELDRQSVDRNAADRRGTGGLEAGIQVLLVEIWELQLKHVILTKDRQFR
jgi:hypothetical protein